MMDILQNNINALFKCLKREYFFNTATIINLQSRNVYDIYIKVNASDNKWKL